MDLSKGEQLSLLFQVAVGVLAVFVAVRHAPIPTAVNNPEPFPNQRFARAAFFVVGAALILGSCWSFWLARHGVR